MERVGTLINKLKEQFDQNNDSRQLLVTAQLLIAELQQQQAPVQKGKVSVTMPSINVQSKPIENISTSIPAAKTVQAEQKPLINTKPAAKKEEQTGWLFDPALTAIPTLVQHNETESLVANTTKETVKEVFELKDVIGEAEQTESLNDKLKESKVEVASTLQTTPVKDLKKAIGINDRYQFINELFRGDEDMYERSIKTINGFNIYAEAEYWIQRELKVKIGWDDAAPLVKVFDQLVKRRFS